MKTINIIETRDIGKPETPWQIRLIEVDGKRHLQMQGRQHEAMPFYWAHGVVMSCPADLTLDDVASDPSRYYRGYGDGCEMWPAVPKSLRS